MSKRSLSKTSFHGLTTSFHGLRTHAAFVAALSFVSLGTVAEAQFLTSSPGPLSRSHAEYDVQASCAECHLDGGKALSNSKCLGCHYHSNLQRRISAGKGYHSTSAVRGRKCQQCHFEHKGRSYNIMGWRSIGLGSSGQGFNHDLAGWKLQGKHGALACKDCHKSRNRQGLRTHLGEDTFCGSCHKQDQPHGFTRRAMLACDRCHTESVWKPQKSNMRFDHNNPKDSQMPIEGSHKDVLCVKCHPRAKFNLDRGGATDCKHCHKSSHSGHLFDKKKCGRCHSPKFRTLKKFSFNHKKGTGFALGPVHKKLSCYRCHTKARGFRKPSSSCETCHASDNRHKNRFKQFGRPPKCGLCHRPSTEWKPSGFNHNRRTKFKLTAKHARIACRKCHRGSSPSKFERFNPKTVGCMGCHQHKNVHDGEYTDKQCRECHSQPGDVRPPQRAVDKIHHPRRGSWPLIRGHRRVKCEKCHTDNQYRDTPKECGTRCHEDSLHQGSLGEICSRCHTPGRWDAPGFDHDKHTNWPLKGFHKTVPKCADCHPERDYSKTPKNCGAAGCHRDDDVHKKKLGNECERCHVETGENLFNHNEMSRYKLDGAHLTTKCSECHPSITFKPRPTNCYGCHPEPEIHKGLYGTRCEGCHSTSSFKDIRSLHDVGDFSLRGAHDRLACQRCHKTSRNLAGSGNMCINCHRQDDIHSNSLSPRCGECHTQWSFVPARFNHARVGCNLVGLHRTLPCYDCHKTGNFGGLSPMCVSCHRDDALRVADHANRIVCSGCHNPNAWLPEIPYGRESVCR